LDDVVIIYHQCSARLAINNALSQGSGTKRVMDLFQEMEDECYFIEDINYENHSIQPRSIILGGLVMGKSNKKIKFLTTNDNIKEIVEEQREHSPGFVESCIIQGNKCFPRHISPRKTDSLGYYIITTTFS
jgi:hypothetical protein